MFLRPVCANWGVHGRSVSELIESSDEESTGRLGAVLIVEVEISCVCLLLTTELNWRCRFLSQGRGLDSL